jgi:class 3 adenylate cyclase
MISTPPNEEALELDGVVPRRREEPASSVPFVFAPIVALHRFLAEEPPGGLTAAHRDVYAFTNWCMLLALCTHLAYIGLFSLVGIHELVLFNLCSVGLFICCLLISRRGYTVTAMGAAEVEVAAHAIVATLFIGILAGFHYHALLVVVVGFLFSQVPIGIRFGLAAAVGASYVALILHSMHAAPWVVVDPAIVDRFALLNSSVFVMTLAGICWYYTLAVQTAREALREEFARSESLLHNILPVSVANRLKEESAIADRFEDCTVLFADMAVFTAWSAQHEPLEIVRRLNEIFSAFDELAEKHGLEKIKTIGDAYMVAAGIPDARPDHADAMARMALDMQAYVRDMRDRLGIDLAIRVGMHSGPAVAGVIGLRKFIYDLWGDTVNTAARMESHGITDQIQVSERTADLLGDRFELQERGVQFMKGKGQMRTFLLLRERVDVPIEPLALSPGARLEAR